MTPQIAAKTRLTIETRWQVWSRTSPGRPCEDLEPAARVCVRRRTRRGAMAAGERAFFAIDARTVLKSSGLPDGAPPLAGNQPERPVNGLVPW
jgi:hypothetical protein